MADRETHSQAARKIVDTLDDGKVRAFSFRLDVKEGEYLVYDLSKTHLTDETVHMYRERLESQGLAQRIDGMCQGEPINYTENRPVLHHLLRDEEVLDKVEAYMDSFSDLKGRSPITSQTQLVIGEGDEDAGPGQTGECCRSCRGADCPCANSGARCDSARCTNDCACSGPAVKKNRHGSDVKCTIDGKTGSTGARANAPISGNSTVSNAKMEIFNELVKIHDFCQQVKCMKGVTGRDIDTIVSIGIGGSDLGPRMVTDALQFYEGRHRVYFISNIDSTNALQVFSKIDPATTLFIVVSKTFTTAETIENYKLARLLFDERVRAACKGHSGAEEANRHFVAVTSNVSEAEKYGIGQVFKMWDFVGGRYSLWSAAGLSIALYIGFGNYIQLLRGASAGDRDFFARGAESIAARLAINELYYIDQGYNNKCLVSYDSYLGLMYKYLQQAEMESNGKTGSRQMIIWGGVGTDVQHSFFQLLHQGEQSILTEFLLPIRNLHMACEECCVGKCDRRCCEGRCDSNCDCPASRKCAPGEGAACGQHCKDGRQLRCYPLTQGGRESVEYHHKLLIANCLAQSRSLMLGRPSEDRNKEVRGDRPSVTVMYSSLTPAVLGAVLAIYEHKIFTEGVAFGINSFDQFGVQLGKDIALELFAGVDGGQGESDSSTNFLISQLKK